MKTSRSLATRSIGMLLIVGLSDPAFMCAQFSDISYIFGNPIIPEGSPHGDGISFYDFNNDGWDDLSISNGSDDPRFYVNNNGILQPAPFSIPNDPTENISMILWADYDNDCDADLLLTKFGAPLQLWNNDGSLNFTEVSIESGLMNGYFFHVGAAFADYDHDGYLDLYISKFYHPVFNVGEAFEGKLYHNNGNGTFSDVTETAGVHLPPRPCFQPVFLDYNADGWEDLFLVIDRVSWPNELFRNNGDGTFTSATVSSGFDFNICAMTGTVTDYDHDQDLDIYITNNPPVGNVFMENNGDGTFSDVASEKGVHLVEVSWGSLWIDYDNDTWEDLFVSVTSPVQEPVGNQYYINNEGEFFSVQNEFFGNAEDTSETFVCARGDLNNDGYYDFAINNLFPDPARLYLNNGGTNNYLSISLEGTFSNKEGIGTWIHCFAGGNQYVRFSLCGENLIGQNSEKYIFGLDTIFQIDSLVLEWNRGTRDVFYNLTVNNHYHFEEGSSSIDPFDIAVEGNGFLCPGDSLILDAGDYVEFIWSNGCESRYLTVTEPGIYSVSVITSLGVTIESNPIEILAAPEAQTEFLADGISCFGETDGSIWVEISTSPIQEIYWNSGEESLFIDNLTAGTYYFNAIDSFGCSVSDTTEIIEPDSLSAAINLKNVSCYNENTGVVSISVEGGVEPYFFNWNGIDPNALPSGDYSMEVLDWNFCLLQIDFTITQPDSLHLEISVQDEVEGESGGSAFVTVSGGTEPYSIEWSNGINEVPEINNLPAGDYFVQVTDANGCVQTLEFTIDFISHHHSVSKADFYLYPNPFYDQVYFSHCNQPFSEVIIHNNVGQVLKTINRHPCVNPIDLSDLSPGCYHVQIDHNVSIMLVKLK